MTKCEVIIPDDSLYSNGVAWDGVATTMPHGSDDDIAQGDRPLPTEDTVVYQGSTQLLVNEMPTGNWSETGTWLSCWEENINAPAQTIDSTNGPIVVDTTQIRDVRFGPGSPLIDVPGLIDRATAASIPPDPPTLHAPPDAAVTQMPTWLWLEPGYWRDYIGTGSSPSGRMTIVATASPNKVTWTTPEETLECDEGTPWTKGLDPRKDSDCITIFEHAYSYYGGPVTISAHATFEGTWAMEFNTGITYTDQGTYGPLAVESSFDIEIHEIQALVTSYGTQHDS